MTHENWTYPEDVPSESMRQHPKPRKIKVGKVAIACCVIAAMGLWASLAQSDVNREVFASSQGNTYDSAGRYILRGDRDARPSPHHSGGGITTQAARYFLSIADRGPFRIEGTWFSSGTMVLALVAGPDAVEGSCLGEVEMNFHEAIPLSGDNSNLNQNQGYSGVFTLELRNWYHTMRNGGGMSYLNPMALDQDDLGLMGYPVCED